jgi:hypothetical protein
MKDVYTNNQSWGWNRLWDLHPPKADPRLLQNLTSDALEDNLGSSLISRVVVGISIEIDELRKKTSTSQKLLDD